MAVRFTTTVRQDGKSATGLPVPDEVVEALGQGRRPPVTVTVGGFTYRTTVASRGGGFVVPLSAERRAAAGVSAGDEVEVDLELDTEPRVVEVPQDFAEALRAHGGAEATFAAMSYSHQLRWVSSIEEAKSPETRRRRIDSAVTEIGGR